MAFKNQLHKSIVDFSAISDNVEVFVTFAPNITAEQRISISHDIRSLYRQVLLYKTLPAA
ncbi:hypothetical protein BVRB_8g200440 [Beta vulgaris subsp. vulgaris]|uniref:Uncharacterized protein n=1 Tax=Beta vulgaris subsp. vulgaris TaxID=3555 RepID=A0A7G2RME5_BETVV|nr:hypothetical protein BVRB_8g200440 [Beta vulgaris subsp. vulgaris]